MLLLYAHPQQGYLLLLSASSLLAIFIYFVAFVWRSNILVPYKNCVDNNCYWLIFSIQDANCTILGADKKSISLLYYTMLCYTLLYYAVLCYDILCYTMLCYAMPYYTKLYYAMIYYAMLYHAILSCTMPCYNAMP